MKSISGACAVVFAAVFAATPGAAQSKTPVQIVEDAFSNFPVPDMKPTNYSSVIQKGSDVTASEISAIAAKHNFKLCNEFKIPAGRQQAIPAEDVATPFQDRNFVSVSLIDAGDASKHPSSQYIYSTNCHH